MKSCTAFGCVVVLASAILPALSGPQIQAGLMPVLHPGLKVSPNGVAPQPLGNVWTIDAQGKKTLLSHSGLANDLKTAPDGKSVGWTEGQIISYEDRHAPFQRKVGYPLRKTRFPSAVIIHRPGKPDLRLVPEKLYTVTWRYEQGGKAVGIGSQGSHGVYYLQLFDTSTGKKIDSRMGYQDHLPAWTQGLGNY